MVVIKKVKLFTWLVYDIPNSRTKFYTLKDEKQNWKNRNLWRRGSVFPHQNRKKNRPHWNLSCKKTLTSFIAAFYEPEAAKAPTTCYSFPYYCIVVLHLPHTLPQIFRQIIFTKNFVKLNLGFLHQGYGIGHR